MTTVLDGSGHQFDASKVITQALKSHYAPQQAKAALVAFEQVPRYRRRNRHGLLRHQCRTSEFRRQNGTARLARSPGRRSSGHVAQIQRDALRSASEAAIPG
jgi:hypothetical protein